MEFAERMYDKVYKKTTTAPRHYRAILKTNLWGGEASVKHLSVKQTNGFTDAPPPPHGAGYLNTT